MRAKTGSRNSRPTDPLARIEQDVTSRVVDLRCIVKRRLTGETLFAVGGRWDRVDKIYLPEPATRGKVLYLNEAQVLGQPGNRIEEGPARALKDWIDARIAGSPRVVELDFDGARGSGKTHFATLAVWLIAIALPEAECWLVSPANTRRAEIERIVKEQMPIAWRTGWSERDYTYTLPNQSRISYLGADDEDGLKRGGYEVALLNEAQLMSSQAYSNAAAGVRNLAGRPKGLLLLAYNYASKERGEWTNDHLDKIEAGAINAKRYKLDPRLNESVDSDVHDDVDGLIRSARPDLADLDSLGIRKRLGDYAAPAFKPVPVALEGHVGAPVLSDVVNIDGTIKARAWRDVTRRETARLVGTKEGFPVVVGMDFQRRPGCVASLWRLFERPDGKVVYHGQKVIVAGDNEDDLCERVQTYLQPLGLTERDALAICDSTGRFQNAPHNQHTKPSHDIVREWGFTVVGPRKVKRNGKLGVQNPDVEDSLAQFYDICTEGRLLVAPGEDAEWLVESLRRCKIKKRGGTIRLDDAKPGYSHAVDTSRYVTWYFEPRRGAQPPTTMNTETFDALARIRLFGAGQ